MPKISLAIVPASETAARRPRQLPLVPPTKPVNFSKSAAAAACALYRRTLICLRQSGHWTTLLVFSHANALWKRLPQPGQAISIWEEGFGTPVMMSGPLSSRFGPVLRIGPGVAAGSRR